MPAMTLSVLCVCSVRSAARYIYSPCEAVKPYQFSFSSSPRPGTENHKKRLWPSIPRDRTTELQIALNFSLWPNKRHIYSRVWKCIYINCVSLGKKNNNWYIGPSTGLNYNGLGDYVVCGYGETRTFKGIRHLELDSWAWYHVVRVSLCAMGHHGDRGGFRWEN